MAPSRACSTSILCGDVRCEGTTSGVCRRAVDSRAIMLQCSLFVLMSIHGTQLAQITRTPRITPSATSSQLFQVRPPPANLESGPSHLIPTIIESTQFLYATWRHFIDDSQSVIDSHHATVTIATVQSYQQLFYSPAIRSG